MVLNVHCSWYRCCCRYSWQAVLWLTLQLDRIVCRHPSYPMWAHNPQFHRIETWHFGTFLFSRLFPLAWPCMQLTSPLPCDIQLDIRLSAYAWFSGPLFILHHRHRMFAYPLETSCIFFCFPRCVSLSLNSRNTLYLIPLECPGWLTLCPFDPLSVPS